MKTRVLAAITTAAIVTIPVSAAEKIAETAKAVPAETERMVSVDGARRLYLDCQGTGSPTVIFEAGYGDASAPWRQVQSRLAPFTQVCAYDRAGMDHSDRSPRPTTGPNVVDDLHRLIQKASIKTPFVLVAHSRGGVYAALYALTYPSQIAGMVLVDPAFVEQESEIPAVSPAQRDDFKRGEAQQHELLRRCEDLATAGKITPANPQGCFTVRATEPAADGYEKLRQGVRPDYYRALASELDAVIAGTGLERITAAENTSPHPFGDLPLIVLTSSTPPFQQGGPRPADDAAVIAIWKHGHDRLAAYSSRGVSIVVPDSGHMIQEDQPKAVTDAIQMVIQDCCRRR